MKKLGIVVALLICAYFIVRAVVEPFVIDVSDPASYQDGWGGPSLLGVLLVHMGPGVLAAVLVVAGVVMWRRRRGR